MPKECTEIVSYKESEKVYKFGSGEIRESKGTVIFPCNIANKDVRIRTEVIDADLPLLIGNTTLEKSNAIMDFGNKTVVFLGERINLHRADSGHYMVDVKLPMEESSERMRYAKAQEQLTLVAGNNEKRAELNEKNLKKLHHYLGHAKPEKLKKLASCIPSEGM